jgi:cyclophilin family peptidyl-prolyl cis-trans isomerase
MADTTNPVVIMETNKGAITIELWADKAPVSVENFLQYADDGHYNGTIFHRVIKGFMIQGGGFVEDMSQKPTRDQIKNEASEELKNKRGVLAMARTNVVDSATSQFFISTVDNDFLDHKSKTPQGYGYAAFAQVTDGMDVVDAIEAVETGSCQGHQDVPQEPVIIESVTRA